MRKQQVVLTTALSLVLIMGFTQWVMPAQAITWGHLDDSPSDPIYPEVGAFMAPLPGWGLTPVCSGTLIHENMFLTAGHCTDWVQYLIDSGAIEEDEVFVSFAYKPTTDPNDPNLLPVAEIITHPDYGGWANNANPSDVGLLILEEPAVGVPTATLPVDGFLDQLRADGQLRIKDKGPTRAMFTVVGYGATEGWPPPNFYYEDVRQYSTSQYQTLLKAWLRLSQNHNIRDDIGGTCYGDSGGPVFWEADSERILVGITSWGDAVCVSSGFNYRVDIPNTIDFIAAYMPGET
jgi:hypothetical protein